MRGVRPVPFRMCWGMSGDGSRGRYLMKLDLKHGTDPKVQLRLKSLKLYFHLQFSLGSSFNIYDGVGVVEGSERTTTTTTIRRRRSTTATTTTTTKETQREKRKKNRNKEVLFLLLKVKHIHTNICFCDCK